MDVVLLLSKYSNACHHFLATLKQATIIDASKLTTVYADHGAVRRALADRGILSVPTVVVSNTDVYQGKAAFTWLADFEAQLTALVQADTQVHGQVHTPVPPPPNVPPPPHALLPLPQQQLVDVAEDVPTSDKAGVLSKARQLEKDRDATINITGLSGVAPGSALVPRINTS
jgi:hypothetical protein